MKDSTAQYLLVQVVEYDVTALVKALYDLTDNLKGKIQLELYNKLIHMKRDDKERLVNFTARMKHLVAECDSLGVKYVDVYLIPTFHVLIRESDFVVYTQKLQDIIDEDKAGVTFQEELGKIMSLCELEQKAKKTVEQPVRREPVAMVVDAS